MRALGQETVLFPAPRMRGAQESHRSRGGAFVSTFATPGEIRRHVEERHPKEIRRGFELQHRRSACPTIQPFSGRSHLGALVGGSLGVMTTDAAERMA